MRKGQLLFIKLYLSEQNCETNASGIIKYTPASIIKIVRPSPITIAISMKAKWPQLS